MSGVIQQRHVSVEAKRPGLVLAGGRRADELRVAPLFAELSALGVPGIKSTMPKLELLDCFEAALTAKAEATRRAGGAQKSAEKISSVELRRAAEGMIAAGARR